MVDALRYIHPNMENRYTCWNQYTNQRYVNVGARIDFFLVDRALLKALRAHSPPTYIPIGASPRIEDFSIAHSNGPYLRCGCTSYGENGELDIKHLQYSVEAGICAATAGSRFQVYVSLSILVPHFVTGRS